MIELLAPAGTPDACRIAIAAGADAVYLGGSRFGARHYAGNFDDQALEQVVAYAHIRGVKIYITVNTLVHDTELEQVVRYLEFLCSIGVDAILIQDLGILSLASHLFSGQKKTPALHASTQMAIHNREGAQYARELGCTRIVLARELPAAEVRDIAECLKENGGEVEIFGHGALCYAYSGQCLLSAVIGGRSGNRGMCAQPCRKPYQLFRGVCDRYGRLTKSLPVQLSGQYLLSTRDLSVYPVLSSIASLPIAALKIEGRMRSPSYVASAVSIYRRALDAVQSGTFSPSSEEETDLALAFSRGFTSGYLNDQSNQNVMGRDLPGRRGLLIGTVVGTTKDGLLLDPAGSLVPEQGDGMVLISNTHEQGFVLRRDPLVRKGQLLLDFNQSSKRGDLVFLTSRGRNIRLLEQISQNPDRRYYGTLFLSLNVSVTQDGMVDICGEVKARNTGPLPFSFRSEVHFSPARSRPLSIEQISDALQKTGGTLFTIKNLDVSCPDNLFAPISMLNGIRREILEVVEKCIITSFLPGAESLATIRERGQLCISSLQQAGRSSPYTSNPGLVVLVSDLLSARSALSAGASRVYIEWYPCSPDSCVPDEILTLFTTDPGLVESIGIKLPKILRRNEMDLLISALPSIRKAGIKYLMVDGVGVSGVILSYAPKMLISGYSGLNIANHLSLAVHSGFEFCTLSCELSGDEICRTLTAAGNAAHVPHPAVIVQGLLEAIITEDNPLGESSLKNPNTVYALKDQKGEMFPLIVDPNGRTHIFNAAETSLIDHIETLKEAGVRYSIIDARWRSHEYAEDMTRAWADAIRSSPSHRRPGEWDTIKDTIRACAWGVLTSATWKRGLCRNNS